MLYVARRCDTQATLLSNVSMTRRFIGHPQKVVSKRQRCGVTHTERGLDYGNSLVVLLAFHLEKKVQAPGLSLPRRPNAISLTIRYSWLVSGLTANPTPGDTDSQASSLRVHKADNPRHVQYSAVYFK
jgi:hypothetical protein